MEIKTILSYPFANPMRPVLFAFLSLVLFLISIPIDNGLISLLAGAFFLISVVLLIISMFLLLFKKEWWKSIYTFLIILAIIIVFGSISQ